MPKFNQETADITSASYQGQSCSDVKRRALFGMITKSAFVAPVVASFALDALTLDKAAASGTISNSTIR